MNKPFATCLAVITNLKGLMIYYKKELKGIKDNIKIVKDLIKKHKLYYTENKIFIDNYLMHLNKEQETLLAIINFK